MLSLVFSFLWELQRIDSFYWPCCRAWNEYSEELRNSSWIQVHESNCFVPKGAPPMCFMERGHTIPRGSWKCRPCEQLSMKVPFIHQLLVLFWLLVIRKPCNSIEAKDAGIPVMQFINSNVSQELENHWCYWHPFANVSCTVMWVYNWSILVTSWDLFLPQPLSLIGEQHQMAPFRPP